MRHLAPLLILASLGVAIAQEEPPYVPPPPVVEVYWALPDATDIDLIRLKWDESALDPTWSSARFSVDLGERETEYVISDLAYCTEYTIASRFRDTGGSVSPVSTVRAYPTPYVESVSGDVPNNNKWHVVTVTGDGFVDGGSLVIQNQNSRGGRVDSRINQFQVDSCSQIRVQLGARPWRKRELRLVWANPDGGRVRFTVPVTSAAPQPDDGEPPPALELKRR